MGCGTDHQALGYTVMVGAYTNYLVCGGGARSCSLYFHEQSRFCVYMWFYLLNLRFRLPPHCGGGRERKKLV